MRVRIDNSLQNHFCGKNDDKASDYLRAKDSISFSNDIINNVIFGNIEIQNPKIVTDNCYRYIDFDICDNVNIDMDAFSIFISLGCIASIYLDHSIIISRRSYDELKLSMKENKNMLKYIDFNEKIVYDEKKLERVPILANISKDDKQCNYTLICDKYYSVKSIKRSNLDYFINNKNEIGIVIVKNKKNSNILIEDIDGEIIFNKKNYVNALLIPTVLLSPFVYKITSNEGNLNV